MRAATLFSGIGAPEVAMPHWEWLWHAEIEPFPAEVMKHHHPASINLGDVSAEDFVERAVKVGRPDILVFGSPCQDFSVAGHRIGLDGDRGNLALVGIRVARELGVEWLVFENVPGLLSSYSGGAESERAISEVDGPVEARCREDSDFAAFLSAVRECGYLGAYRVFDAQFAGVPQRRRRLFFVGRLGDWAGPASVLFEPESMRGDSAPSRSQGKAVAGSIRASAARRGGVQDEGDADGLIPDVAPPVQAGGKQNRPPGTDIDSVMGLIPVVAPTLQAGGNGTGGHRPPGMTVDTVTSLIPVVANPLTARTHKGVNSNACEGQTMIPVWMQDVSDPLIANETSTYTHEGTGNFRTRNVIAFDPTQITCPENRSKPSDLAPMLAESARPPAIAFQTRMARNDRGLPSEVTSTLVESRSSEARPCIAMHAQVRRLTPRECERLQAFPDDYTLITYRKKVAADGPRYRALGNSMCVKDIGWILQRIEKFEAL